MGDFAHEHHRHVRLLHDHLREQEREFLLTAYGAGGFRIDAFDLLIREHLDEVFFLELVGLAALLDLAQEPGALLKLESPKLLKPRRRAIPAQEFLVAVVHIVIARPRRDQGGELALIRFVWVAHIDNVHPLDCQVSDLVDFVIAFHAGQLRTMLGIEIGHQQRLHGAVVARLPAFLELTKCGSRRLLKFLGGHRGILPG